MIASLSSFIEFMAAVYVTMSIDNLIARRFWTRDYESMLGALFIKWRVPYVSKTSSEKAGDIEDLQKSEEHLSRRRGLLMLALCVFLLVYIGYEPDTKSMDFKDVPYTYFSLVITYVFVLCAFFFDRIFLSSRWRVVISILGLLGLFFLCEYLKDIIPFSRYPVISSSLFYPAPAYTVATLILPVIWQLIRNWLYSQINMVRIQYRLRDELKALEQAKSYNNSMDINEIAECYRNDAVKKVSSFGTEDSVDGNMIQTFNTRLREIIKIPKLRDLFCFINKSPLENLENTGTTVYYSESVVNTFDTLCDEYKGLVNKPAIVDFANSKQVNPKEFREYYQKWIIKHS